MKDFPKRNYRIIIKAPILLLAVVILFYSCGTSLGDQRAIELIRLNYKQQSGMEGAGKWLLDSVEVGKITDIPGDSIIQYKVVAYTKGIYTLPVLEDTPEGYSELFYDTVQFIARQNGKVWMSDDWTIIGSRHE